METRTGFYMTGTPVVKELKRHKREKETKSLCNIFEVTLLHGCALMNLLHISTAVFLEHPWGNASEAPSKSGSSRL